MFASANGALAPGRKSSTGAAECQEGLRGGPRMGEVRRVTTGSERTNRRRPRRGPRERDPLAAAWNVIDALWREECEPPRAQAIIAALRLVVAAGEAPLEADRALREAEVLGLAMHGLPPRDAEEAALAEELFGRRYWEEGDAGAAAPAGDGAPPGGGGGG